MKKNASLDLHKYKSNNQETINDKFLGACKRGDLNAVKFLLTNKEIPHNVSTNKIMEEGLSIACRTPYIEIIKYLTQSWELDKRVVFHDKEIKNFKLLCAQGSLENVKYVVENPFLENIYTNDYLLEGCIEASEKNKLETVRYLVNINKFSIYAQNDKIFKQAFKRGSYEVLNYLLIEKEITIYPGLKVWLSNIEVSDFFNKKETKEYVTSILAKRDFKNNIEKNLDEKEIISKEIKKLKI